MKQVGISCTVIIILIALTGCVGNISKNLAEHQPVDTVIKDYDTENAFIFKIPADSYTVQLSISNAVDNTVITYINSGSDMSMSVMNEYVEDDVVKQYEECFMYTKTNKFYCITKACGQDIGLKEQYAVTDDGTIENNAGLDLLSIYTKDYRNPKLMGSDILPEKYIVDVYQCLAVIDSQETEITVCVEKETGILRKVEYIRDNTVYSYVISDNTTFQDYSNYIVCGELSAEEASINIENMYLSTMSSYYSERSYETPDFSKEEVLQ